MKLRKQFSNLKKGAKKVFIGMLILCLVSTATGIGSIFASAVEDHDHVYQDTWQYYDELTHRKYCTIEGCDDFQQGGHSYTDWEPYGDGLQRHVCSECQHEEIQEIPHTHSFGLWQPDPNNSEQHIRYCEGCDAVETDSHNIGDWTLDQESGKEKRICQDCGYIAEEREAHDHIFEYSDNNDGLTHTKRCSVEGCSLKPESEGHTYVDGVCVCGARDPDYAPEEPEVPAQNSSTANQQGRLRAFNLPLRGSASTAEGLVETNHTGNYTYSNFFSSLPTAYTDLIYNGNDQDLFSSTGTFSLPEDVVDFNTSGLEPQSGNAAATYTPTERIDYQVGDDWYYAVGSYTVSIDKASFANDVVIGPDTNSFVETLLYEIPYYNIKFNDKELVKDTDYTVTGTAFGDYPVVGTSQTYTFTGAGNFDNTSVSKTILVEDVYPTFNGSTNILEVYHGDVKIEPPAGYSIAPDNGGTPGTFVDSITYTAEGTYNSPLYFKYNDSNKIIQKTISFRIDQSSYTMEQLVSEYPEFYADLEYTGSALSLKSKAPVMNDTFITDNHLSVTYGFKETTDVPISEADLNPDPQESAVGVHKYYFFVHYQPNTGGQGGYLYESTPYKTIISKSIDHANITYTAVATDYQSLDSSTPIKNFYNVTDAGAAAAQQQLQTNVDYSVAVSPEASYYEAGSNITLTYTGLTNEAEQAFYRGTNTKTVPVSTVNVLLNGAAQVTSYDDEVRFTATGYTISDTSDGTFNTTYVYSEACNNVTLPLYFKKDGTSRIVKQDITGLTIGGAAAIKLKYDGEETLKPYYVDTVRITAPGYKIWNSKSRSYEEVYNLDYDSSKKMDPIEPDKFVLKCKDNTTGLVYDKRPAAITIIQSPNIDIKYNGDTLKDWYNDSVKVTASGYTISDDAAGGFTSSYLMTGSGVVSKKLYFKNSTTSRVQSFMVTVAIDKTAPTGVINISSYSSDSFTTTDSVKAYTNGSKKASISASDALSGVDYIHFYVSDTFYSSPSDVVAAVSEKNGVWRAYSSSSQPTTVKDKNNYIYAWLVDKAGNESIISLGSILYDTVAPKMTTAKVTPATDGTSSIIGVAGTDKLSGVDRFKFIYGEKKEGKNDTPSKKEVFENGMTISTEKESDGTSVGSRTITDIDPKKIYMFYFVAVDRADNISEVMLQEVKGADAASKEAQNAAKEEAKKGSSSGASGLTPSPSGIAGSGSGSGKQGGSGAAGAGASKSSKDKKSQSALGDKDREINRNPYIAEATGNVKIGLNETSGWNKIASEVNKADKGAVIEVEMAGLSNVSNELFTSMNNRDVQVKLRMAEDVEWEIKGEEVPDARSDIDMGVRLGSRNIPEQIIADVAGTNPHVEFSINHNGDFGFVATIAVPVGESNKGMYTTLYHYDETKKELEVAGDGRVDDRGYAKFPLTHASDYTVVITPERILSAADTDAQTSTLVGAEAESQSSQYLDGARLRLTDLFRIKGSMRIWLFFIALLSATICMVILYLPALQSRNQNDQGDLF